MPKEVVYSDSPEFILDGENELPADQFHIESGFPVFQRAVQVGWSRDRHVEVGVAMFEMAAGQHGPGHWTSLDRAGVNRLIRILRKARDSAFGADA